MMNWIGDTKKNKEMLKQVQHDSHSELVSESHTRKTL